VAKQDFKNTLAVSNSLPPAAVTATATGTGVDLANQGGATVVFAGGTRTDGTHTPSVEESADNSSWSAVAAGDLLGTLSAITSNSIQAVGYIGSKRYIRPKVTVTGSPSTGAVYGAHVILHGARKQP
jgi:hypothetical protein